MFSLLIFLSPSPHLQPHCPTQCWLCLSDLASANSNEFVIKWNLPRLACLTSIHLTHYIMCDYWLCQQAMPTLFMTDCNLPCSAFSVLYKLLRQRDPCLLVLSDFSPRFSLSILSDTGKSQRKLSTLAGLHYRGKETFSQLFSLKGKASMNVSNKLFLKIPLLPPRASFKSNWMWKELGPNKIYLLILHR